MIPHSSLVLDLGRASAAFLLVCCLPSRGHRLLAVGGVLLIATALAVYLMDPLERIIQAKTYLGEGTTMFELWRRPTVPILLYVYMFNVTNSEEFLSGREKLHMTEVGPFVYREIMENVVTSFNRNGTVNYRTRSHLEFQPHLSALDPQEVVVTTLNIPFVGAASMLYKSSIITNLGLRSVASYLNSQPFLNLTVDESLMGYDDPLVGLGNNVFPSLVDFDRFGVLERMYSYAKDEMMSMRVGPNPGSDPTDSGVLLRSAFCLDAQGGSPGMKQWGYGETTLMNTRTNSFLPPEMPCNMIRGSLEGLLYPRKMTSGHAFMVYRKAFCRTFLAEFEYEALTSKGYNALWYTLASSSMNLSRPENACYCPDFGECLPLGLVDISPCYHNIPLSLSMPHFYKGEPRLRDAIDGIRPDEDKHKTYIAIEPTLGIPLELHCRLQVNLVVRKTRLNPVIEPLNGYVVPIMWIDYTIGKYPADTENLVWLALVVGPVLQNVLVGVLGLAGVVLVLSALVVALRASKHNYNVAILLQSNRQQFVT